MNKEELLKIYSAYLPYRLQVQSQTGTIYQLNTFSNMRGQGIENRDIESVLNGDFKPLLWDLSYLTKEIEHEGERFVPIRKIYEINGWEWNDDEANEIDEIGICSDLEILTYATAQLLLSWHFNIFSLPEGEYINKATLTNK